MQLQIRKWGNSAAVRLPQAILAQFHLNENDCFDVEMQNNRLVLRPIPPQKIRYDIRTLMAEMNGNLPMIEGWEEMPAVGKELE
ncbi:AbrB/MazE/SpoVT family DNA-binding domain-containing protein [Lonepinella sp. BR2271]|uniref:AbrB/MazE/SpoVT family DNA-binding domain-containing protein n=1 Tax=Lonepinella sp. BR2271 TaxID=3434550 RepID=UPI003F6E3BF4